MAQRQIRHNQTIRCESLEARQMLSGTVFTVTTTANGGAGSLRHAIVEANAAGGPGTIDFDLSGSGVHTIALITALPAITQSDVTIDGTSQMGYRGSPLIQVSGGGINAASNAIGLDVQASDVAIKGLIINGFSQAGIELGILSSAKVVTGDTVSACWIGTDSTGNAFNPAPGQGIILNSGMSYPNFLVVSVATQGQGIIINSGDDLIGGATGDENVISGNVQNGIDIIGGSGIAITNNNIGTNVAGTAAFPNGANGIFIDGTVTATIGGSGALGNLISGNSHNGIAIKSSATIDIYGNNIGTNAAGTAALGNGMNGIRMAAGEITIGQTGPGNIISGNGKAGIVADEAPQISVSNGTQNEAFLQQSIVGNKIGTNAAGDAALANAGDGVLVIDGAEELGADVISGNGGNGVHILGGSADFFGNNLIGTNAAGTAALGNANAGIMQAGGNSQIDSSVISGNGTNGINIVAGTSTIDDCQIGTDANGRLNLGNGANGIRVMTGDPTLTGPTISLPDQLSAGQTYNGGPAVQIGNAQIGDAAPDPSANVIAFNGKDGILLTKNATAVIRGNSIFSNTNLGIDYLGGTPSEAVLPTIESVTTSSSGTTITFTVPYTVAEDNYVDFYVSPAGSSAQGETYLGSMDVHPTSGFIPDNIVSINPIGIGQNVFTFTINQQLTAGEVITATNTRGVQAVANGPSYQFATSPFSSAFAIS